MKKINIFIILASTQIIKSSTTDPNQIPKEISRPETTITRPSLSAASIKNAREIVLNPEKAGSFDVYEQAIETVINNKGIKTSWTNSPNIDSKFLKAFQEIRAAFEKNGISSLSSLKVALESYFEYFKDADKVENKAKIADEIAKLIKSKPTILRTEIIDRLNQNQEAPSPQQNAEKTITDIAQVLKANKIYENKNIDKVITILNGLKDNPYIKEFTNGNEYKLIELIAYKIKENVPTDLISNRLTIDAKNGLKDAQIKMLKESKFYETGKRIRAINNLKRLAGNNTDDHTINEAIHENTNVFERFIAVLFK